MNLLRVSLVDLKRLILNDRLFIIAFSFVKCQNRSYWSSNKHTQAICNNRR